MLWANSANDKLMIAFLFFQENRIRHFMQSVKSYFLGKIKKYFKMSPLKFLPIMQSVNCLSNDGKVSISFSKDKLQNSFSYSVRRIGCGVNCNKKPPTLTCWIHWIHAILSPTPLNDFTLLLLFSNLLLQYYHGNPVDDKKTAFLWQWKVPKSPMKSTIYALNFWTSYYTAPKIWTSLFDYLMMCLRIAERVLYSVDPDSRV